MRQNVAKVLKLFELLEKKLAIRNTGTIRPADIILGRMPKFVPRQRKQKALRREAQSQSADAPQDSNALEITPLSKDEKEERRRKLKEELRAQQPKVSSKKQKRLDKYIVRLDTVFFCVAAY
jgi:hypothetical protein